MDLNDFSKEITDTVNKAIKSGCPILMACAALDSLKFQLQMRDYLLQEQINKGKLTKDMADGFKPEVIIEEKK